MSSASAPLRRSVRIAAKNVAAPVPAVDPDAALIKGVSVRMNAIENSVGLKEKCMNSTALMNFLRLNAMPIVKKYSKFRDVTMRKCLSLYKDPRANMELKESCMALLAEIVVDNLKKPLNIYNGLTSWELRSLFRTPIDELLETRNSLAIYIMENTTNDEQKKTLHEKCILLKGCLIAIEYYRSDAGAARGERKKKLYAKLRDLGDEMEYGDGDGGDEEKKMKIIEDELDELEEQDVRCGWKMIVAQMG